MTSDPKTALAEAGPILTVDVVKPTTALERLLRPAPPNPERPHHVADLKGPGPFGTGESEGAYCARWDWDPPGTWEPAFDEDAHIARMNSYPQINGEPLDIAVGTVRMLRQRAESDRLASDASVGAATDLVRPEDADQRRILERLASTLRHRADSADRTCATLAASLPADLARRARTLVAGDQERRARSRDQHIARLDDIDVVDITERSETTDEVDEDEDDGWSTASWPTDRDRVIAETLGVPTADVVSVRVEHGTHLSPGRIARILSANKECT